MTDAHQKRAEQLDAELRANDERRVGPMRAAADAVWCLARRPDGTRVVVIGYLP